MSYRLYVDTSVFGALFDEEDQERVKLTGMVLRRIRHARLSIVHSVNAKFGYRLIDIISPLEVPRE